MELPQNHLLILEKIISCLSVLCNCSQLSRLSANGWCWQWELISYFTATQVIKNELNSPDWHNLVVEIEPLETDLCTAYKTKQKKAEAF